MPPDDRRLSEVGSHVLLDRRMPVKLTLLFLALSIAWVFLSDAFIHANGKDPDSLFSLHLIRGWVFVASTTLLLFYILYRSQRHSSKMLQTIVESERSYRTLMEHAPDGIFLTDEQGNYLDANSRACELSGYTREELLRLNLKDLIPADDAPLLPELFEDVQNGRSLVQERRLSRKDGSPIFCDFSIRKNDDGKMLAIVRDVTERRNASVALQATTRELQSLMSSVSDYFWSAEVDRQKGIIHTYYSPVVERITGRPPSYFMEAPGRWYSIIHPDDLARLQQGLEELVTSTQSHHEVEYRIVRPDDTIRWVRDSVNMTVFDGGKLRLDGIVSDITEHKSAQASLRESEEKFEKAFRSSPDSIAISTLAEGRYIEVNDSFQKILGYSREETLGRSASDLGIWQDPADRERLMQSLRTSGSVRNEEYAFRAKGGEMRTGLVSAEVIDIAGKQCLLVVTRDITERKRAEQSLLESEERYRRFFEDDLTGDYISTVDGRLLSCNPAFLRIFGFSSLDEALQTNMSELYGEKSDRRKVLDLLRNAKKLEYHESELRQRDGKPVFVVENIVGVFDAEGELTGLKGYLFDNTELKRLEDHVRQAQKIESLGTLAGGIAHDFNNLLGIISGHASLLKRPAPAREDISHSVDAIHTATQRGAGLVKQLLTFARKAEVNFEPVNLNGLVEELTRMLKETFPKTITLVQDLGTEVSPITGDANQIHQALLNMCINARDAMPHGGTLRLQTFTLPGSDVKELFDEAHASLYACVTVEDTGLGMDEETRQRIFEPFFTTKGRGRGTGLGLSVVYGIAKGHQGFVNVTSRPGHGSTFNMFLPAALHVSTTMDTEVREPADTPGGTETILIAEDETLLMYLVKNFLEEKGYRLITATDGEQLIRLYTEHRDSIHMVLSDLGLPKMGGWEACKQILRLNPAARVIIASGFIDPLAKVEMAKGGILDFIEKPYSPREILVKIRTVLDTRS